MSDDRTHIQKGVLDRLKNVGKRQKVPVTSNTVIYDMRNPAGEKYKDKTSKVDDKGDKKESNGTESVGNTITGNISAVPKGKDNSISNVSSDTETRSMYTPGWPTVGDYAELGNDDGYVGDIEYTMAPASRRGRQEMRNPRRLPPPRKKVEEEEKTEDEETEDQYTFNNISSAGGTSTDSDGEKSVDIGEDDEKKDNIMPAPAPNPRHQRLARSLGMDIAADGIRGMGWVANGAAKGFKMLSGLVSGVFNRNLINAPMTPAVTITNTMGDALIGIDDTMEDAAKNLGIVRTNTPEGWKMDPEVATGTMKGIQLRKKQEMMDRAENDYKRTVESALTKALGDKYDGKSDPTEYIMGMDEKEVAAFVGALNDDIIKETARQRRILNNPEKYKAEIAQLKKERRFASPEKKAEIDRKIAARTVDEGDERKVKMYTDLMNAVKVHTRQNYNDAMYNRHQLENKKSERYQSVLADKNRTAVAIDEWVKWAQKESPMNALVASWLPEFPQRLANGTYHLKKEEEGTDGRMYGSGGIDMDRLSMRDWYNINRGARNWLLNHKGDVDNPLYDDVYTMYRETGSDTLNVNQGIIDMIDDWKRDVDMDTGNKEALLSGLLYQYIKRPNLIANSANYIHNGRFDLTVDTVTNNDAQNVLDKLEDKRSRYGELDDLDQLLYDRLRQRRPHQEGKDDDDFPDPPPLNDDEEENPPPIGPAVKSASFRKGPGTGGFRPGVSFGSKELEELDRNSNEYWRKDKSNDKNLTHNSGTEGEDTLIEWATDYKTPITAYSPSSVRMPIPVTQDEQRKFDDAIKGVEDRNRKTLTNVQRVKNLKRVPQKSTATRSIMSAPYMQGISENDFNHILAFTNEKNIGFRYVPPGPDEKKGYYDLPDGMSEHIGKELDRIGSIESLHGEIGPRLKNRRRVLNTLYKNINDGAKYEVGSYTRRKDDEKKALENRKAKEKENKKLQRRTDRIGSFIDLNSNNRLDQDIYNLLGRKNFGVYTTDNKNFVSNVNKNIKRLKDVDTILAGQNNEKARKRLEELTVNYLTNALYKNIVDSELEPNTELIKEVVTKRPKDTNLYDLKLNDFRGIYDTVSASNKRAQEAIDNFNTYTNGFAAFDTSGAISDENVRNWRDRQKALDELMKNIVSSHKWAKENRDHKDSQNILDRYSAYDKEYNTVNNKLSEYNDRYSTIEAQDEGYESFLKLSGIEGNFTSGGKPTAGWTKSFVQSHTDDLDKILTDWYKLGEHMMVSGKEMMGDLNSKEDGKNRISNGNTIIKIVEHIKEKVPKYANTTGSKTQPTVGATEQTPVANPKKKDPLVVKAVNLKDELLNSPHYSNYKGRKFKSLTPEGRRETKEYLNTKKQEFEKLMEEFRKVNNTEYAGQAKKWIDYCDGILSYLKTFEEDEQPDVKN